jgi:dipeptidyl aminopeptidase/acylaminoacyl peptidase
MDIRSGPDGSDIWYYDLSGESQLRQLTLDGVSYNPSWSPDGESIVFASTRDGTSRIYRQSISGGVAQPLTTPPDGEIHGFPDWAPDGRLTYFAQSTNSSGEWDGWITEIPDGRAEPLINYPRTQAGLRFSPDGNAMAYWSTSGDDNQSYDIYVEPFPPDGSRTRVAAGERAQPWPEWMQFGDTSSLIYQRQGEPSAILDITIPGFAVSNPREGPRIPMPGLRRIDSIPGTNNLLIVQNAADEGGTRSTNRRIIVVKNWVEELKERVRGN